MKQWEEPKEVNTKGANKEPEAAKHAIFTLLESITFAEMRMEQKKLSGVSLMQLILKKISVIQLMEDL